MTRSAVILGLGSIGQRHARLLAERPAWHVMAARSGRGEYPSLPDVTEVADLADAVRRGADVAFVCSPTSLHANQIAEAARLGLDVFVEKPLANTLSDAVMAQRVADEAGVRVVVGTVFRHHPLLRELHRLLEGRRVLFARSECVSWLPDWQPGREYRSSYRVSRALGGGIVLDLIHEIDMMDLLLGDLHEVGGRADSRSSLGVDVPDHAHLMAAGSKGEGDIFLAWYSRLQRRRITVWCDDVTAELDLLTNTLTIERPDGESSVASSAIDRDDLFRHQLDHLETVLDGGESLATLATAVRQLEVLHRGGLVA